eukprot:7381920-Prymnesium_polylepis.1
MPAARAIGTLCPVTGAAAWPGDGSAIVPDGPSVPVERKVGRLRCVGRTARPALKIGRERGRAIEAGRVEDANSRIAMMECHEAWTARGTAFRAARRN